MTMGAWRRWDSPPTIADMAEGICEERRPMWLSHTRWLRTMYGLDGEISWADEETGWVLRYRRNDRALVTLLPDVAGCFGALVVVGPSQVGAALAAPLSEPTHNALEFSTAYADGHWLWLKVTEPAVAEDVERLVALKVPPPARRREVVVAPEVRDREPASAR